MEIFLPKNVTYFVDPKIVFKTFDNPTVIFMVCIFNLLIYTFTR